MDKINYNASVSLVFTILGSNEKNYSKAFIPRSRSSDLNFKPRVLFTPSFKKNFLASDFSNLVRRLISPRN